MVKLCELIGSRAVGQASDSHLDLGRAPYALYGVKYIDLVSPVVKLCELMRRRAVLQASDPHLDLGRALYGLYGARYIDPVSIAPFSGIVFDHIRAASGKVGIFDANAGFADVAFNNLPTPVAAQYLRIYPHECTDPGLRIDAFVRPIGSPIGLGDGTLPPTSIQTSSDKLRSKSGDQCRIETPQVHYHTFGMLSLSLE